MDKSKLRGVLTLVLALGLIASVVNVQGQCIMEIDPTNRGFVVPLLMGSVTGPVLYPELLLGRIIFRIPQSMNLIAACPGNSNGLKRLNGADAVDLTCHAGNVIIPQQNNKVVTWSDLECLRCPRSTVKSSNTACGVGGKTRSIGWAIRGTHFTPLIELCFDDVKETTEFAKHSLQGRIIGVKMVNSCQRPKFRKSNMFKIDVHKVYEKKNEVALFKFLLDTDDHLTGKGEHYLARGHLAPDSDFFYIAGQDATYFYGNVVPQWQSFNNGNWKRLEYAVRTLAESHQTTFTIWTGAYSTLEFLNPIHNNAVSMFLGRLVGQFKIPVPALLWKVIYDPLQNEAVAIVSINEVAGEGFPEDTNVVYPPCTDVCHLLTWVTWNVHNTWSGRTFCCNVNDPKLRAIIPTLPTIPNVLLLKI